jgi:hypothetical protein
LSFGLGSRVLPASRNADALYFADYYVIGGEQRSSFFSGPFFYSDKFLPKDLKGANEEEGDSFDGALLQ